jgi:hypothetical protein
MDVGIDQAGHQRAIAEVNNLRIGGMLDRCAGFHDALALNENIRGRDEAGVFDIEHVGGVENDRTRFCSLRLRRKQQDEPSQQGNRRENKKSAVHIAAMVGQERLAGQQVSRPGFARLAPSLYSLQRSGRDSSSHGTI